MNIKILDKPQPGGAVNALVYGLPGVGKTTLVSKIQNVLILDTEFGSRFTSARRVMCGTMDTLRSALDWVTDNPAGIGTIAIDTVDMLWDMAARDVCRTNGWADLSSPGYGSGYTTCAAAVQAVLRQARRLTHRGINVIYVSHADIGRIVDQQGVIMPRLAGCPAKQAESINYELIALADYVGYITRQDYAITIDSTGTAGAQGKSRAWPPARETAEGWTAQIESRVTVTTPDTKS